MQVARDKVVKLTVEEFDELFVDGRVKITDLPSMQAVHLMDLNELIVVLRHCPFAETFGQTQERIS